VLNILYLNLHKETKKIYVNSLFNYRPNNDPNVDGDGWNMWHA